MNKITRRLLKGASVALTPTVMILHGKWISYLAGIPWEEMRGGVLFASVTVTVIYAISATFSEMEG